MRKKIYAGFMLIYVYPAGFALKYAEILPVPVISDTKGDAIWEEKANDILKKVTVP
jgi:hypothetical protein